MGVPHGHHSNQLYEIVYRTPEGVWINSAWSLDGPWMHFGHRFSFWQFTLDRAAEWFPQNFRSPPEILFEDFERQSKQENRSLHPNLAEPFVNPDPPKLQAEVPPTEECQASSVPSTRQETAPNRIPSVEQLTSISAALHDLLATFAKYKLFLDNPSGPIDDAIPQYAMLESLCRLEKLLNPRRLPYGSPELASHIVRSWPYEVMTAYPKLRKHVYRIIERWDVPEICQDQPFARGVYGITADDGTIKGISRPPRTPTLTQVECGELAWILNAMSGALQWALEAIPNPSVRRKEHEEITDPKPAPVVETVAATTGNRPHAPITGAIVREQVFISYSHQDRRFLDELILHLKPYLRKGTFRAWSDEQIRPGSIWFEKIKHALARTSAAVLLVSPDFLASDFIDEHELGPLLKEAEASGVTILWVLIHDCSWKETRLQDYQAVLPPDNPLGGMKKARRHTAWQTVCQAIRRAVTHPLAPVQSSHGSTLIGPPNSVSAGQIPSNLPLSSISSQADALLVQKTRTLMPQSKVICPLHGIRTLGAWQKGLSDLAGTNGWVCRLDRWSFGKKFSIFAFLAPWTREAKLSWLRGQYDAEIHDRRLEIEKGQTPSVVAHSFGTYILGYTLLRFDFIRFNKVILCGSILPTDFPWDKLIGRGQVQAVRNEYGVRDPWVKHVRCFVRGTGSSGAVGFTCKHDRLEQEEFEYDHGDYFGIDHMEDRWIPFLDRPLAEIPRTKDGHRIPRPVTARPWCLYSLVLLTIVLLTSSIGGLAVWWNSSNSRASFLEGRGTYSFILGKNVDEATNTLKSRGMEMRVVVEDGEQLMVTKDHRRNRVNVETRSGLVERIVGVY